MCDKGSIYFYIYFIYKLCFLQNCTVTWNERIFISIISVHQKIKKKNLFKGKIN